MIPIIRCTVLEGQSAHPRRRVLAKDGTGDPVPGEEGKLILSADVSQVSYTVYELEGPTPKEPVAGPADLSVGQVIFNTLQTDWNVDPIGYNFQCTVPAAVFTDRTGGTLRLVVLITLTSGNGFQLPWDLQVENLV